MDKRAKKEDIYGNHEMYSPPVYGHPNGVLMYRNKKKRIQWYLDRNLARLIKKENGIITAQMIDMPKGLGRFGDEYMPLMENKCVVTGKTENLNRHHIVPRLYRNLMPLYYKKLCHHDIVAIDVDVHAEYEIEHANVLKEELAEKYNAPLTPSGYREDYYISGLAFAYKTHNNDIPKEKCDVMFARFQEYLNKSIITDSDIDYLISLKLTLNDKVSNHGRIVLEAYNDMQGFVEMWRQHFLDTMKPKHMPDGWNLKRPIDIVQTYSTNLSNRTE